jgi:hypothetical protein
MNPSPFATEQRDDDIEGLANPGDEPAREAVVLTHSNRPGWTIQFEHRFIAAAEDMNVRRTMVGGIDDNAHPSKRRTVGMLQDKPMRLSLQGERAGSGLARPRTDFSSAATIGTLTFSCGGGGCSHSRGQGAQESSGDVSFAQRGLAEGVMHHFP